MAANLLARKETAFVLWRVGNTNQPPTLIIGQLHPGTPITFSNEQRFTLQPVAGFPHSLQSPRPTNLTDGQVYHYWFEFRKPPRAPDYRSPTHHRPDCVGWRICACAARASIHPSATMTRYPAAVIKFAAGRRFVAADVGGETGIFAGEQALSSRPANNHLVIYELPTTWTRSAEVGGRDIGLGTFRDVTALIDADAEGANFDDLDVTRVGRAYLTDSASTPLNSFRPRIASTTANGAMGPPIPSPTLSRLPRYPLSSPAPHRDLTALVRTCHTHGMRFFCGCSHGLLEKQSRSRRGVRRLFHP